MEERQPSIEDNLRWMRTFNGRQPSMEDHLRWKMTFDGRRPSMEDNLRWKTTFDGRRPSMEDDIRWKTTFFGKNNFTTMELGEGDYGTWSHDAKPYSYFAAHSALRHFISN